MGAAEVTDAKYRRPIRRTAELRATTKPDAPTCENLRGEVWAVYCGGRGVAVAEKAGVFRCRLCGNVWRVA